MFVPPPGEVFGPGEEMCHLRCRRARRFGHAVTWRRCLPPEWRALRGPDVFCVSQVGEPAVRRLVGLADAYGSCPIGSEKTYCNALVGDSCGFRVISSSAVC